MAKETGRRGKRNGYLGAIVLEKRWKVLRWAKVEKGRKYKRSSTCKLDLTRHE
jgi:hypothetical protein